MSAVLVEREVLCYCGRVMRFRPVGKFGPFYGCPSYPECDGIIGCHPNGEPLGIPAPKVVRDARIKAHAAFDAFWQAQGWKRRRAYKWLQEAMGMDEEHAHIAMFTAEDCDRLVSIIATEKSS